MDHAQAWLGWAVALRLPTVVTGVYRMTGHPSDLRCGICRRPMIPSGVADRDDDPRIDCAGDCLGCVRRIEARPHTETARYWKAMYEDQVRRKRSLHERYDDLHKRNAAAESERDFWRRRYKEQHRTLHSCEDALAVMRDLLGRIRWAIETGAIDVPDAVQAIVEEIDAVPAIERSKTNASSQEG